MERNNRDGVCRCINSLCFVDEHGSGIEAIHIVSFEESDENIIFSTPVKIQGIERGYVGDMHWRAKGRFLADEEDGYEESGTIPSVLCIRINKECSPGNAMVWTYHFLKS